MPDRKSRLYAFISAADDSGPAWQVYARRLGAPLALGIVLGAILYAIAALLPHPLDAAFIIVVAVSGFAWTICELRRTRRMLREIEETVRRAENGR